MDIAPRVSTTPGFEPSEIQAVLQAVPWAQLVEYEDGGEKHTVVRVDTKGNIKRTKYSGAKPALFVHSIQRLGPDRAQVLLAPSYKSGGFKYCIQGVDRDFTFSIEDKGLRPWLPHGGSPVRFSRPPPSHNQEFVLYGSISDKDLLEVIRTVARLSRIRVISAIKVSDTAGLIDVLAGQEKHNLPFGSVYLATPRRSVTVRKTGSDWKVEATATVQLVIPGRKYASYFFAKPPREEIIAFRQSMVWEPWMGREDGKLAKLSLSENDLLQKSEIALRIRGLGPRAIDSISCENVNCVYLRLHCSTWSQRSISMRETRIGWVVTEKGFYFR